MLTRQGSDVHALEDWVDKPQLGRRETAAAPFGRAQPIDTEHNEVRYPPIPGSPPVALASGVAA
jgi:hypothetical protein